MKRLIFLTLTPLVAAQPCQLCPDGLPPVNLNREAPQAAFDLVGEDIPAEYDDIDATCASAFQVVPLFLSSTDPECQQLLDTTVRSYCGCPFFPEEIACPLCVDRTDPPSTDLVVGKSIVNPQVTMNCEQVQLIYGGTTETEKCSAFQDVYGVYCGCASNAPNNAGVCRLCGSNKLLDEPSKFADERRTCADIEFETSAGMTSKTCAETQAEYGSICCGGGADDETAATTGLTTTAPAPTLIPTLTPDTIPTKAPTVPPTSTPRGFTSSGTVTVRTPDPTYTSAGSSSRAAANPMVVVLLAWLVF